MTEKLTDRIVKFFTEKSLSVLEAMVCFTIAIALESLLP